MDENETELSIVTKEDSLIILDNGKGIPDKVQESAGDEKVIMNKVNGSGIGLTQIK